MKLGDKVYILNGALRPKNIVTATVQEIRLIKVVVKLDGLYFNSPTLSQKEVFKTKEECIVYHFKLQHKKLKSNADRLSDDIEREKENLNRMTEIMNIDKIQNDFPELFI